jgi:enolase
MIQIKAGAPCRERVATYNGLMRLEKEAEGDASYVGKKYRRPCDLN